VASVAARLVSSASRPAPLLVTGTSTPRIPVISSAAAISAGVAARSPSRTFTSTLRGMG